MQTLSRWLDRAIREAPVTTVYVAVWLSATVQLWWVDTGAWAVLG